MTKGLRSLRRVFFVSICLVVSVFFVFGCNKKDKDLNSWEKVQAKGEFIFGFDESFPPMGYRSEGKLIGFDIDLAEEVTKRLGIKLKLQPIAWDMKEQELQTYQIDCIWNGFSITPERKAVLDFTTPYMNNKQIMIVLNDSDIMTLDDLSGKVLALQRNSSATSALNKFPELKASLKQVYEFDDNLMAMTDLDTNNSNAVLMDIVVANFNYIKKSPGKYRILEESLSDEEFGVGFRKGDVELKDKVEATLLEMVADGTMAKISEKWFGSDITTLAK